MSVVITLEDIRAYAEVDYIINHVNIKYQNMVPEKLKRFFSEYKDPNIEIKINPYIPLQSQGLSRYSLEIIALIHLKYWCEDDERKEELYQAMLRNQARIDESMKNRFDIDGSFGSDEEEEQPRELSEPKTIQVVEIPSEETNEEEQNSQEDLHEEASEEDNHPTQNEIKEISIIEKIKNFFLSIFGNKK